MLTITESCRKEFPLTCKWVPFIKSYSYQNNLSFEDSFQEALLLEWEVSKKIQDLYHRQCYYRKSLYRKLYSLSNNLWNKRKVDIYKNNDNDEIKDDLIENIVIVKPFDSLFYDYLVLHISQMLIQIDEIANEIFLYRLKKQLKWKEIKKKYYSIMAHNRFYNKVKVIKKCIIKEIMYG